MGTRGIWVFIPEGKSSGGLGGEAFNLILGIVVIALIVSFIAGFIRPTYEYKAYDEETNKTFFLTYQKWVFGDEVSGIYTYIVGDATKHGVPASEEDRPDTCFKGTIKDGHMYLVCKKLHSEGEIMNLKPIYCKSNRATLSWLDFDLYGGRNWFSFFWERWVIDEFKPYQGFRTQP